MSGNFKILFLLAFLNLLQIIRNTTISKCTELIDNTALYSLNILIQKNDLEYNFTVGDQQYTLFYNFCVKTQKECNGTASYAIAAYNTTNQDGTVSEQCFHLSNLKYYEIDLLQAKNYSKGIEVNMEQDDNINLYSSSISMYCNKSTSGFLMERMHVDVLNSKHFIFEGESQYGCPTELSTLWQFLSNNKYFFFVFLAILGAAECLYGYRFIILTFFLLGFATGFLIILIIVSEFINILTLSIIIQVLILFGSGVIGLIVGYGATSLPRIGVIGLGVWLGLIVALMLNGLVFHKISTTPANLILYILIGVFCLGFAALTFWFWKKLIIISTSFVGSYMFVRAFSLIFKGFPNEFTLQKQLNIGAITSLSWKFYIYLAAIVILGLIGIFFQLRNQNTEEADKKMEGVKFELKIPFLNKNHNHKEGDQENNLEMQELNNSENFQFEQNMKQENMQEQNSNQKNFQQNQYTRKDSESLRGSDQNQRQYGSNNPNQQNLYESPLAQQQFFQQQMQQGQQNNQQNYQNNNNMMNVNYNQNQYNPNQGQIDENFTFQPNFDNQQPQNYQQQFDNNNQQQYYQGTDSLQQQFYDNQGQEFQPQQVQQEKKRKKKKKHHDSQQQQDAQNNFQTDYNQTQNYQENQQFQDPNNQQYDNFAQQSQQQFQNNQNYQQEIPQFSSEDNNNFNQQQQLEDINIDNQQQGDNQDQVQGQTKKQKRKKK